MSVAKPVMGQSSKSSSSNCGLWTCSTAIPGELVGNADTPTPTTAPLGPSWHFSVTPGHLCGILCARESLGAVLTPARWIRAALQHDPGHLCGICARVRAWGGPHPRSRVRIAWSVTGELLGLML